MCAKARVQELKGEHEGRTEVAGAWDEAGRLLRSPCMGLWAVQPRAVGRSLAVTGELEGDVSHKATQALHRQHGQVALSLDPVRQRSRGLAALQARGTLP